MSFLLNTSGGGGGSGGSVTIVDDFEDGSITEYTGATSDFSANTNTPTSNGSYSLKHDTTKDAEIISTSGLSTYPAAGDTYAVSCFPTTKYCGLLFGVQNSNNLYLAQINVPDGNLNLFIKSGGSYTTLNQNKSASLPSNERIRVEVDWTTSGFTVTAIDNIGNVIADVSSTNTVYSSGGIGFRGDTGVAYDYARIL